MTQTTKVAPRTVNRNFAYDDEAYHEVKRNLGRLIDAGQLRPAMQLALGLMKQGSYQVEMSDEGLMAQAPSCRTTIWAMVCPSAAYSARTTA